MVYQTSDVYSLLMRANKLETTVQGSQLVWPYHFFAHVVLVTGVKWHILIQITQVVATASIDVDGVWCVRMSIGREDDFCGSSLSSLVKALHRFLSMNI